MSGECDKCDEHCLECICNLDHISLITKSYEKHDIKYSLYEENNRFYGTPIPDGYEAIYIDDEFCPPSLQIKRK